jgi:hypothetical protein
MVGRAPAQLRTECGLFATRIFRTLQDRLTKELARAGIAGLAAANRFEAFLPALL